MERDYGLEIDELKKEIEELKELIKPRKKKPVIKNKKMDNETMEELKRVAEETDNEMGLVNYHGFLNSGNREAYWWREDCSVKDFMAIPSEKISLVLSSLGNQQRWEILCALLRKPMTVAQIVEMFDMKTTGKAYHHINKLFAADVIEEVKDKKTEKGTYTVKANRVQGIMMILAGISDLLDTHYSSGEWNE